jgi:hypothetical protein
MRLFLFFTYFYTGCKNNEKDKKRKKIRKKNIKSKNEKSNLQYKVKSEETYDYGPQIVERYIFLGIFLSAVIMLIVYFYGLIMILIT